MIVLLFAAESGADWGNLAQYGVLGMVVLAFIFGKMVPGYIYEKRTAEYEAEKAENRRLEKTIQEQVIPAPANHSESASVLSDLCVTVRAWRDMALRTLRGVVE